MISKVHSEGNKSKTICRFSEEFIVVGLDFVSVTSHVIGPVPTRF